VGSGGCGVGGGVARIEVQAESHMAANTNRPATRVVVGMALRNYRYQFMPLIIHESRGEYQREAHPQSIHKVFIKHLRLRPIMFFCTGLRKTSKTTTSGQAVLTDMDGECHQEGKQT
jgi:hypothetical protein